MEEKQFILSSVPLRQLNTMISLAVREELKAYQFQDSENSNASEKLLTVQEAAEFLNLSKPTIYAKVSSGELPVMKRSKRLYFSRQALTEYIKAGSRKTKAEIEAEAEGYIKKKRLNHG